MFSEEEIRGIYNGFQKKDMPFTEFRKQVKELTDPAGIQRDVSTILANKQQIDRRK